MAEDIILESTPIQHLGTLNAWIESHNSRPAPTPGPYGGLIDFISPKQIPKQQTQNDTEKK